jgi:hypothetical protein
VGIVITILVNRLTEDEERVGKRGFLLVVEHEKGDVGPNWRMNNSYNTIELSTIRSKTVTLSNERVSSAIG